MTDFDPLIGLKVSIQRALLGEVTQQLDSVTCGLKDRHILIRAYFAGKPAEEDIDTDPIRLHGSDSGLPGGLHH